MLEVEQHEKIRKLYYLDNKSMQAIADQLGLSRPTISKALKNPTAPHYTLSKPRPSPRLGNFKTRLEELLVENRRLPRKQRYTTHKIFQLLQSEGYAGSESSIQNYAVQWRKAHQHPQTFLPLEFEAGQEAQVDWGEAQAYIGGILQTVQLFVMRLCYSRCTFLMAFPSQKQEAFFEGHVKAFQFFGGVPRRLSYDNLSTAVKIVTEGRIREEQRAFVAFRSYYLFESHFCTPGQGHEKGQVEHGVGFGRRNFMVPIPRVASFEELNSSLRQQCEQDTRRIVSGQSESIGQLWEYERRYLQPLPSRQFECCVSREVRLNQYSQVTYETNRYSVAVELARKELVLKAYPFRVDIWDGQKLIASHPRCYAKDQDLFDPLHYLALLEQRPGAFEYAKPLKQWRQHWPALYEKALGQLKEKWPDNGGVKEFIRILKLHQHYPAERIERAVRQALVYGCVHFDGVLQCLHQQEQPAHQLSFLDLSDKPHLAELGQQPVELERYDLLVER